MENNIVVYTAITGDYDHLNEPQFLSENCDYICFSDNPELTSDIWKIRKIEFSCDNPIRVARKYKIMPHLYFEDYAYSIWMDGSMMITGDIVEFGSKLLGDGKMAFFKHYRRNCIYDEAKVCVAKKKDDPELIAEQIKRYELDGYGRHQGLIESGVMIRQHNEPEVIQLMEEWWNEVTNFSIRDQLSFNYVAWKNQSTYQLIDQLMIRKNDYFKLTSHKRASRAKTSETPTNSA